MRCQHQRVGDPNRLDVVPDEPVVNIFDLAPDEPVLDVHDLRPDGLGEEQAVRKLDSPAVEDAYARLTLAQADYQRAVALIREGREVAGEARIASATRRMSSCPSSNWTPEP